MEEQGAPDNHGGPPRAAVVIPTHNRRELVLQAVESALAQTVVDFELIVVDDGSTDGTREALEGLDPRLQYHWQQNRGASAARNAALRLSSAPVVAFLDSDDRWRPNHLEVVLAGLERHPQAVLISTCPFVSPYPRSVFGRSKTGSDATLVEVLPEALFANRWGMTSCIGARREALVAIGGFDEGIRVAEDADLLARLALCGPFALVRSATVAHGMTAGSLTRRPGLTDEYLDMLTTSATRVIAAIDQTENARAAEMASAARGAMAYVDALKALYHGDEDGLRHRLHDACDLFPRLSNDPSLALMRPIRIAMLGLDRSQIDIASLETLARCWPGRRRNTPMTLRWWLVVSALKHHRLRKAVRDAFVRPALILRPDLPIRVLVRLWADRGRRRRWDP